MRDEWSIESITQMGLSDRDTLNTYIQAWQEWARDPRSYYCLARVEVVGWKPESKVTVT